VRDKQKAPGGACPAGASVPGRLRKGWERRPQIWRRRPQTKAPPKRGKLSREGKVPHTVAGARVFCPTGEGRRTPAQTKSRSPREARRGFGDPPRFFVWREETSEVTLGGKRCRFPITELPSLPNDARALDKEKPPEGGSKSHSPGGGGHRHERITSTLRFSFPVADSERPRVHLSRNRANR
jgi:hypothetical protein